MHRIIILALAPLLTGRTLVNAQATPQIPTGAKNVTQEEQQVRQAWTDFTKAMVDGNTTALEALMESPFTLTHITGYKQPRSEWLSQVRSGHFDYHRIENRSVTVTVKGKTATLVSKAVVNVTIGGGRGNWNLQSTLNFVQNSGKWVVSSYVAKTY